MRGAAPSKAKTSLHGGTPADTLWPLNNACSDFSKAHVFPAPFMSQHHSPAFPCATARTGALPLLALRPGADRAPPHTAPTMGGKAQRDERDGPFADFGRPTYSERSRPPNPRRAAVGHGTRRTTNQALDSVDGVVLEVAQGVVQPSKRDREAAHNLWNREGQDPKAGRPSSPRRSTSR